MSAIAIDIGKIDWAGGGFSIDLQGTKPPVDPDNYMVSLAGFERQYDMEPSVQEVKRFVVDNLAELRQQRRYVGGWMDDGQYFLDVSVLVNGLAEALGLASANGQRAIYHLVSGRCLEVANDRESPKSHPRTSNNDPRGEAA